jgi:hypothetical protein
VHFRYFGAVVTNQNLIQEIIKKRLNSGNACYHSDQNLLSSCLLCKHVNVRIYKTKILPGSPLWSEFLTTDPGVRGSIPGHYKKKVVGLEGGPLGLVSTTEELLDRKVAAPV